MPDTPRARDGLLDTSVLIARDRLAAEDLAELNAISTVTLAELAAGPHATMDPAEKARRQALLQWAEGTFEVLDFDAAAARAYGPIYAAAQARGRKPRGRRALDLLIAAVARANQLPLYTLNPTDFLGFEEQLEVVGVVIRR